MLPKVSNKKNLENYNPKVRIRTKEVLLVRRYEFLKICEVLDKLKTELFIFLKSKFETVEFKSYGALHITTKNPLSPIIRLILAYLMNIIPPLRTFFGTRNRKVNFCCLKKIKNLHNGLN